MSEVLLGIGGEAGLQRQDGVGEVVLCRQFERIHARVKQVYGERLRPDQYVLNIRIYGKNGTMGALEPVKEIRSHELCLLIEVTAPSQDIASSIAGIVRHQGLHLPIPEWSGLITALAFGILTAVLFGRLYPDRPIIYTIISLTCLGYAVDSPEMKYALKQLDDLMLEEGGIEAFLHREVLPHAADAWYVPESVKIGYEISFTRYFYKPQPLRTLEEIRADILADEALHIADNENDASKARNQIQVRQWLASKLYAKRYGDRIALAGDKENPIHIDAKVQAEQYFEELLVNLELSKAVD